MGLNNLRDFCHSNAVAMGWWNDPVTGEKIERNKAELICLMHSELDDKLPHRLMEEVELADVIIRIMDYCGAYGLDIEGTVNEKILYNKNRDDHKKESRIGEHGKKF